MCQPAKMFQCIYMIPSSSLTGLSNNARTYLLLLFGIYLFSFKINYICFLSEFSFLLQEHFNVTTICWFHSSDMNLFESPLSSLVNRWSALILQPQRVIGEIYIRWYKWRGFVNGKMLCSYTLIYFSPLPQLPPPLGPHTPWPCGVSGPHTVSAQWRPISWLGGSLSKNWEEGRGWKWSINSYLSLSTCIMVSL